MLSYLTLFYVTRSHVKAISRDTLRKVMKKMNESKSHGVDLIDSYSLKLASQFIEDALLHMINLSIQTNQFVNPWKIQLLMPLHKKNDKLDPTNYRPVSHIVEL